jgi:hypothetical protein
MHHFHLQLCSGQDFSLIFPPALVAGPAQKRGARLLQY